MSVHGHSAQDVNPGLNHLSAQKLITEFFCDIFKFQLNCKCSLHPYGPQDNATGAR